MGEDNRMTAREVLQAIGDISALDNVARHWKRSMAALPAEGIPFLREGQWSTSRQWCTLSPELDPSLAEVSHRIQTRPALRRLCWHAYWRAFVCPESCSLSDWPEPAELGEQRGLFYLLIALAFVPLMRELHRSLGVPEDVTRETARQGACYCDHTYRRAHQGRPGIFPGQLSWLRHYTREPYFRLGRLEYWLRPNPYDLHVYRHRRTGRVIAFAPAGQAFTGEGFVHSDPKVDGEKPAWVAGLSARNGRIRGHVLSPCGVACRTKVSLSLAEWECVLTKGDPSLQLHIPSGGGLTPAACRGSFERADAFFRRYFPAEPPRAVVCTSWIFNPQLQTILGPAANLSRFQRQLFLFPVASSPWDGLWFVFLQHGKPDLATAPSETRLQRAILDFLRRGNRWRCGGMFYLMADIPRFGEHPYRDAASPEADDTSGKSMQT